MNSLLIQELVNKYIGYYGKEVHMSNHMLKVYSFARNIAILEGLDEELLNIIEVTNSYKKVIKDIKFYNL